MLFDLTRKYDSIILLGHCKDELVFFYDYLSHDSLVVLISEPPSSQEDELFKLIMIHKGCDYVILTELDSFDPNFVLSNYTQAQLSNLSKIKYNKLITQTAIVPESDPITNHIYQYITYLQLPNHYTLQISDINPNKIIPQSFIAYSKKYIQIYISDKKEQQSRLQMYANTYRTVNPTNLIKI
jgi:hypothetical protein